MFDIHESKVEAPGAQPLAFMSMSVVDGHLLQICRQGANDLERKVNAATKNTFV